VLYVHDVALGRHGERTSPTAPAGMKRAPDRLWRLVVVVLCVRVTCTPAENDGAGVFVHYSEIGGYGFRSLEENQHVEFEVPQGPRDCRPPTSAPPEPGQARHAQ
jgi:'Cold-shock' DNA-binding domain